MENQSVSEKIVVNRYFSSSSKHPFEQIGWNKRDAVLSGADGKPVFEQKNIDVPESWSDLAFTIASQKYFRGNLESELREKSVGDLISRVCNTIADWGIQDGYFNEESGNIFREELIWLCVNQYAAFNSPVWFNVGVEDVPQASACFILKVNDDLESILDLAKTEAMIFKGGSGSGINFSSLRSSKENLSGGGKASGPVCFMKGFDSFAGVIKSGGKTRRAAKMVILNAEHPDIFEFIDSKIIEEDKARALVREGYDGSFDGEAWSSVYFQNANHSVRVTDEFMSAVTNDEEWSLKAVTDGTVLKTVKAREIWNRITDAAWKCGDPGLQFDTTINKWHTCPESGRINASNPCSEFMFIDESACNLASLNLLKFLESDNRFNTEAFVQACQLFITAMEIIVDRAGYPTPEITKNSKKFRPLGLGYTNLGGLLMTQGIPYDSVKGRSYAGVITSIMTAASWIRSAKLASVKGPFEEYEKNKYHFHNVISLHMDHSRRFGRETPSELIESSRQLWETVKEEGQKYGLRNAQVTLLAPTGTIGFLMDSDSTGIEPMVALVVFKHLVGGGTIKLVTRSVAAGLKNLGYNDNKITDIIKYLEENGTMEGAPHLNSDHLDVFDTALRALNGTRSISPRAHLNMMAAVQPFLSGAISKTVNLPGDTTNEEISKIYIDAWKMGLKSVALYREGSKGTEPLSLKEKKDSSAISKKLEFTLVRKKLPDERLSVTHKFEVGGHEGYITIGYYPDGDPGEVFIAMAKEGSTISGLMDAFSIAISIALQHGVPLTLFCEKFMHTRFEPSGITTNPDIPVASSLLDYIFRWLFLKGRDGIDRFVRTNFLNEKCESCYSPTYESNTTGDYVASSDAPICPDCGFVMVRNGSCYKCMNCGSTSGCS
ncbi:vitamin B12-dependent ribonucleotide reductase [Myxococcota bacterium]|nr:vitamin B12-dependent ribonucleotide reductase [Myxococcota bacterium]MBU1381742.1 vitamin B12-dependent ribonucleotide reductase [Myxococcota bacterium]MBU1496418.1 vitamin B12-dependent ribonucleotide reductase [Myxococcota bacterium]